MNGLYIYQVLSISLLRLPKHFLMFGLIPIKLMKKILISWTQDNMDVTSAITERRSIRKYKIKDVPEDVLQKVLEAGMLAPSAAKQTSLEPHRGQ